MKTLLSALVVLAASVAVCRADDDKPLQVPVVDRADMSRPQPSISGTAWLSLSPTEIRAALGFTPVAEDELRTPDETFAATLGGRFGTSAIDGRGAHTKGRLGDPSFMTFHPWLQLSGTLASGRAWYRLSGEVLKNEEPINLVSGTLVQTTRLSRAAPRLAWQVSPRNRLALEYRTQSLERDHLGLSSTLESEPSLSVDTDLDSFALTWFAPASTNLEVRSSLAWREETDRVLPSARGRSNDCVSDSFLENAYCKHLVNQRSSGSHYLDVDAAAQRLSVRSQVSLRDARFWGAEHALKAGFTVINERRSRMFESRPRIEHVAIRPLRDPDAGAYVIEDIQLTSAFVTLPADSPDNARGTAWSLYVEDAIRPRDNLILTLGGLLERSELSSEGWSPFDPAAERERFLEQQAAGLDPEVIFASGTFTAYEGIDRLHDDLAAAIGVPSLGGSGFLPPPRAPWPKQRVRDDIEFMSTDFSPYLSISWAPWSSGKTRFALSARRRHDAIPLEALVLAQNPATSSLRFLGHVEGTQVIPTQITYRLGHPEVSTRTVSRDLGPSTQLEYLLTLEREVSTSTLLRLSWVDRRYRDRLRSQDVNHLAGDFGRCQVDLGSPPYTRPGPLAASPGSGPLAASPGSGFELTDAYTGETYIDTEPGDGDGRLDDCRGTTRILPGFFFGTLLEAPDGRPDLYKQNPGWGSVVVIDNSGHSDYQALVVELIRRQQEDWQFHGSYTWSRHRGNFDRLGAFDEMDPSLSDEAIRYQANDRRHELLLEATARIGRGYRLGGSASWMSGLPYSILEQGLSFDTVPDYGLAAATVSSRNRLLYAGDRNRGRNDGRWLFNVVAARAFSPRSGAVVEVSVAVDNLLNDDTYQVYNPDFGAGLRINGIDSARREFGRRWQVGLTANY